MLAFAVSFLSPAGLLLALAVAVPLAGLALLERRAARVRRLLRLGEAPRRARAELVAALVAVAALLGLAAAQPVLAVSHDRSARGDAEVLFAFDISRSMGAALGPGAPTRLDRARTLARRVRAALGDVPAGIVGLTDQTLPVLFATANESVFDAAVAQSVGIERPPPAGRTSAGGRATTLAALAAVARANYFSPGTPHRLLIVLSDDESNPFVEGSVGAVFRKPPRVQTIFVRFWNGAERIWKANGRPDPLYRPDPTGARTEATLAEATRGRAFQEDQLGAIVAAARSDLGRGAARRLRIDRGRTPIAPWLALAAVLPLGLVLRRRNA